MLCQGRTEATAVFHGLRQQAEKDNSKEPYLCLSDFIAPKVLRACERCSTPDRAASDQGLRSGSVLSTRRALASLLICSVSWQKGPLCAAIALSFTSCDSNSLMSAGHAEASSRLCRTLAVADDSVVTGLQMITISQGPSSTEDLKT